jgi:hypothetical protein
LTNTYFAQANEQIGTDTSNYYIFGTLQNALRKILADGIAAGSVTDAVPLAALPDHPAVAAMSSVPTAAQLQALLGLTSAVGISQQDLLNLMKLEAPLAVQVRTRSGLFPGNKFSSVPLLAKAARMAENESAGDDVKKRLMIVPKCHVIQLQTDGVQVTRVNTSLGSVPVPPAGKVVLAMATIESTRLALLSFRGTRSYGLIGQNLIAHLRSNLNIRVPVSRFPGLSGNLEEAALFLKGRHQFADGSFGHYHLQITAAGGAPSATDAEADLFKKIPDIDQFDVLRKANAQDVIITIRAIGEMETNNRFSSVRLDQEPDEYQVQRAFVSIAPSLQRDQELWQAMDRASDDVALLFAGGRHTKCLPEPGPGPLRPANLPSA